MNLNDRVTRS